MSQTSFEMIMPADMHVHFRDDEMLNTVAPLTARQFDSALVMPNLLPPVRTASEARKYQTRILSAISKADMSGFLPLMTCYLVDDCNTDDIVEGFRNGSISALKLYPAGATTNSDMGLTDFELLFEKKSKVFKLLEQMEHLNVEENIPAVLCMHGEVVTWNGREVDPFDREGIFYNEIAPRVRRQFPYLKIVAEHISTKIALQWVQDEDVHYTAASVTPHHLLINRTDLFRGGMRPHLYCLPPVKRSEDQRELRIAVMLGDPHLFAGTDSAPHLVGKKHSHCCPGGVFSAHAAVELYAQVFWEERGILDNRFESFMSLRGPTFYGIECSKRTLFLIRAPWHVADVVSITPNHEEYVWPFGYDPKPEERMTLDWRIAR